MLFVVFSVTVIFIVPVIVIIIIIFHYYNHLKLGQVFCNFANNLFYVISVLSSVAAIIVVN